MIPLSLKVEHLPLERPLVVRLRSRQRAGDGSEPGWRNAYLRGRTEGWAEYDLQGFSLRIHGVDPDDLNGDVVLLSPGRPVAHRLIRAKSPHNTLLVTEQCDQTCIICSQPPKKYHFDLFDQYLEAVELAPANSIIGVSGGEPMLHKQRLREFLLASRSRRPDVSFHVLTNGQHFDEADLVWIRALPRGSILWGVPIYSAVPAEHDRIVAKQGAYDRLLKGLSTLARAGAAIELRTVPMKSNAATFGQLGQFIATNLPFIHVWAIMQLENIGYARQNWNAEFLDTSRDFSPIAEAMDITLGRGVQTLLYNFPLCTVPRALQIYCQRSISDWKQKYVAACSDCGAKDKCSGFFEWYPERNGFEKVLSL